MMAGQTFSIFISSVQAELKQERCALKDYIVGDPLLGRFFPDVFLFEDLPAKDQHPEQAYLDQVKRRTIFLGIFGHDYGHADAAGISPTEHEFNHATTLGKTRLIYVWGGDDGRDPRMQALIGTANRQLIRRRALDLPSLTAEVYASLVEFLQERGAIHHLPFDAARCPGATLRTLSAEKVRWFLQRAVAERQFAFGPGTPVRQLLTHLNLLDGAHPSHAAVLLFADDPHRFIPSAELKCLHVHGTEVRKPLADQKNFHGPVFAQVDQARDFILAKLVRRVGTRALGSAAPVEFEIPPEAIAEALVNAVAHRDYRSAASVEVRVFADRVEVWNPGALPAGLTPEALRDDHSSHPRNPLLAEPLYLAHYIEKAGTGTQDMIRRCREAGLPEPSFEQRGASFVVTLWRDWLTAEVLAGFNLNERQLQALPLIRQQARFSNRDYQTATGATRATAKRDLEQLVAKGLIVPKGSGRGAHYEFRKKRLGNGPIGSASGGDSNGS